MCGSVCPKLTGATFHRALTTRKIWIWGSLLVEQKEATWGWYVRLVCLPTDFRCLRAETGVRQLLGSEAGLLSAAAAVPLP
jgi:hypothetical protein